MIQAVLLPKLMAGAISFWGVVRPAIRVNWQRFMFGIASRGSGHDRIETEPYVDGYRNGESRGWRYSMERRNEAEILDGDGVPYDQATRAYEQLARIHRLI